MKSNLTTNETFEAKINYVLLSGKKSIVICDGNDEAYRTGFANYLMDNFKWFNRRGGFEAYLTNRI